jgi:hypothetical protein
MQDLKRIYDDIKTKIKQHANEPAFIYTGIGTAAGMCNAADELDAANYHQYPPLIQEIKKTFPSLYLYIVLIDPYQEKPPYMIRDMLPYNNTMPNFSIENAFNNENNDNNTKDPPILYIDEEKKMNVYTLAKYVTALPYQDPTNVIVYSDKRIDITDDLRDLNRFAIIETNVTTLYHDFSGRRNDMLAEYFDDTMYPEDLNHIVYGLSTREDHGCYFDLAAASSFMPFRLMQEGGKKRVTFFNIFAYIRGNKMHLLNNNGGFSDVNDKNLIELQRESVLLQIKNDFKNSIFTIMRVLLKLICGEEKKEDINNIHIFGYIPYNKRVYFEEKFGDGHYRELFDYLINFFSKKMEIVVKLKGYDFTGRELLGFIINEHEKNMYTWIDTLNYFIPS